MTDYLDVLVDLIADYEKRSEAAVDTSNLSAAFGDYAWILPEG